jgi:hypothetical protein
MGQRGQMGHTGPRGQMGHTGPRGEVGHTGPRGQMGHTGPQGVIGPTGPNPSFYFDVPNLLVLALEIITGYTELNKDICPSARYYHNNLVKAVDELKTLLQYYPTLNDIYLCFFPQPTLVYKILVDLIGLLQADKIANIFWTSPSLLNKAYYNIIAHRNAMSRFFENMTRFKQLSDSQKLAIAQQKLILSLGLSAEPREQNLIISDFLGTPIDTFDAVNNRWVRQPLI